MVWKFDLFLELGRQDEIFYTYEATVRLKTFFHRNYYYLTINYVIDH